MAMHKSEELVKVVWTLDKELNELGIEINGSQILTDFTNPKEGLNSWYAREGQTYLEKFHVPNAELPLLNRLWKARKKGLAFYTEKFSKAEKDRFFRWLYRYSDFRKIPKERQEFVYSSLGWVRTTVLSKNSAMVIQRFNLNEFTREEEDIFKRFGKVFEQAYTRFLDLQKAEAQAREAQIEAALERVRSRTMAMHQSNELADTAAVLFKQLMDLGIAPNRLYIGIMKNKSGDVEFWITDEDGSKVSSGFSANLKENRSFKKMLRGWIENKKSITIDMKGKELQDYFQHLQKLHVPFKGGLSQKRRVQNIAYFSQGLIGLASPDLQPQETINLLERFASVFNLTYRRFLDLQKAEAQAREAEIELAMERVRARTMAMQKSEELKEVIQLVYDQFVHLKINVEHTGFILDYKTRDDLHIWLADQREIPSEITIPCFDSIPNNSIKEAKERGQDFFTYLLAFGK